MANEDEERLVVLLEARIRDLEKNMAKASGVTARTYREMSLNSRKATDNMERDMVRSTSRINQALATTSTKIGDFGKSFARGMIGGLVAGGVAGILTQIQSVAKGVAEVGDEANRAGLSLQTFQELKYVAEQNRIGVDSLTDGIKELNLRADEFISTGGGSAAEAFGRLGYSADQLSTKLKDPAELFTEIIGKLQQLDRAAQIRIADELFGGTGGEKFVQLIEQGEDGIRATRREAHTLGVVMSEELVERADELDRKFNAITASVGTGLKTAIVEAAGALQDFVSTYQGWAADYESRRRIAQAGETIGAMAGKPLPSTGDRTTPKTGRLPADKIELPAQVDLATKYLADYRNELAMTNRERSIAAEAERILSESSSKGLKVTKEQAEALAREKVARDEGEAAMKKLSSERERSASRTDAERQKVQELIGELEEELHLINATDAERRAAEASRMAGAAATEEERAKIMALNEALYQEEEARRSGQDDLLLYRDLTRSAIDDLLSGAEQGKSLWESMGDAAVNSLKRIASVLLDDVLNSLFKVNDAASGGGFLSSLLGGLFGGGGQMAIAKGGGIGLYAKGTNFASGGPAIVGERGPELVNLPRGSQVIPNHRLGQAKQGDGAQSVHVTSDVRVSVDQNGNLQAYVEKTASRVSHASVKAYDNAMPGRIAQINRNPSRR